MHLTAIWFGPSWLLPLAWCPYTWCSNQSEATLPTLGKISKSGREPIFYGSNDKRIPLAWCWMPRGVWGSIQGFIPPAMLPEPCWETLELSQVPFRLAGELLAKLLESSPSSLMGPREPSPSAWLGMTVREPGSLSHLRDSGWVCPTQKAQNLPASKVLLAPTPHGIPGHGKNHRPLGKGRSGVPRERIPSKDLEPELRLFHSKSESFWVPPLPGWVPGPNHGFSVAWSRSVTNVRKPRKMGGVMQLSSLWRGLRFPISELPRSTESKGIYSHSHGPPWLYYQRDRRIWSTIFIWSLLLSMPWIFQEHTTHPLLRSKPQASTWTPSTHPPQPQRLTESCYIFLINISQISRSPSLPQFYFHTPLL